MKPIALPQPFPPGAPKSAPAKPAIAAQRAGKRAAKLVPVAPCGLPRTTSQDHSATSAAISSALGGVAVLSGHACASGDAGPDVDTAHQSALARLEISITDRIEDVAEEWAELMAVAPATPYQQLSLLRAWNDTLNASGTIKPRIAIGRNASGIMQMILPLGIKPLKMGPIGRADALVWLGGKQINYNQGLFAPELLSDWTVQDWKKILSEVLDLIGPDLVCLLNQPQDIETYANPLKAITHRPSPSPAFAANIAGTPEAVLRHLRNKMSRKKLRRNARRLEEMAGPINLHQATSETEIADMLQKMRAQRMQRDSAYGVPSHDILKFLARAAAPGPDGTAPAVELFMLKAGDETVATFGCAVHAGRASGMFISFDCERYFQATPGDIILSEVVSILCVRGFSMLDLGIGDFEYKRRWCDQRQELFDIVAGHRNQRGSLAAAMIRRWLDAKAMIKKHPTLYRIAHSLTRSSRR